MHAITGFAERKVKRSHTRIRVGNTGKRTEVMSSPRCGKPLVHRVPQLPYSGPTSTAQYAAADEAIFRSKVAKGAW
jgi:hypothetical protein